MSKTALVVSAHAADFVWRCAGAIALHQGQGCEVTIVCLSFGERGESAKLWKQGGHDLATVKTARRAEAETAAARLDAHDIQFFDLGDYPLGLDRDALDQLAAVMRDVQPGFILTHAREDPYNSDHAATMKFVLDARMIAQAWGHQPGGTILGAPQVYLFEPHQPERCNWKPDTILDISTVWDKKRAAIEAMQGQEHLWDYYTNVAQNRANQFRRNSGGQAGGRAATHAEAFESVFPRTVDGLV